MNTAPPLGVKKNVALKELTWWKVGGEAEYYVSPSTVDDLKVAYKWAHLNSLPISIISGGSNILIPDGTIKGLTLNLRSLSGIEEIEENAEIKIKCLAGTPKSDIAREFLKRKLPPAVFLTGIPGDMGGGVVMNAGIGEARVPREFCEIVRQIEVIRWNEKDKIVEEHIFKSADLSWSYRSNHGWEPGVVTRVWVAWENSPKVEVLTEVREATKKRVKTQPLDLPSGGSVFRNPQGQKAAQLIESCGLKGFRIGGAAVSTKHANFIVNDQKAASLDVHNLICHVRNEVEKQKGIRLQTEVVYIGDWDLN